MSVISVLLIGIFLPLFPLSIVFNYLFGRLRHPLLKCGLLLLWPVAGVIIFSLLHSQLPSWGLAWAALTALFYGFRLLTRREINGWIGFLATSVWSLLWFALQPSMQSSMLLAYALGFTIPLALLVLLADSLEQRFGAAYTHLYGGLAGVMPRFSAVLVFTTLAATATPVFPAFFIMLKLLVLTPPVIAGIVLLAWLTWSWSGVRLMQGLLTGPANNHPVELTDMPRSHTLIYILALITLAVAGLYVTGDIA